MSSFAETLSIFDLSQYCQSNCLRIILERYYSISLNSHRKESHDIDFIKKIVEDSTFIYFIVINI